MANQQTHWMPRCGLWVHRFHQDFYDSSDVLIVKNVELEIFSSQMRLFQRWEPMEPEHLQFDDISWYDVCFTNLDMLLLTLRTQKHGWKTKLRHCVREKYWLATFCRSLQVGLWITLDRQVGKKECFLLQLTAWKAQHNCIGKRKQFLHVKGERDRESESWWSFLTIKVSWICRVLRLKGFGHVAAHEDSHRVFHRFHGESFRLPADICRLSSVSTLVQGGVD